MFSLLDRKVESSGRSSPRGGPSDFPSSPQTLCYDLVCGPESNGVVHPRALELVIAMTRLGTPDTQYPPHARVQGTLTQGVCFACERTKHECANSYLFIYSNLGHKNFT